MQTFLPYRSFSESAACLDRQRLGKQRVEALQILRSLVSGSGWRNHPAVRMWEDHRHELITYGVIMCREWKSRGYRDSCEEKILACGQPGVFSTALPEWLTDEFCLAHRSNLIRKNPEHYRPLWPDVPDDLPYIWPKEN